MNKDPNTLTKLAIVLAVILAVFVFVAGSAAGAAFLLTRDRNPSQANLTDLTGGVSESSMLSAGSSLLKASMLVTKDGDSRSRFSLSGELQEIDDDTITVAGQTIQRANANLNLGELQVGSYVVVAGTVDADGTLIADAIYPTDALEAGNTCVLTGRVEALEDDTLVVEGKQITIVNGTTMPEGISTDSRVLVEGILLEEGELVATDVQVLGGGDEREFEFQGYVENINPWVVAGVEIEQDNGTQVDAGIKVGSPVVVRGVILEDGTWLSREIRLVSSEPKEIVVIFLGTVENTNPWIVNGLTLSVGNDAVIDEGITAGTLVRVEAVLRPDGTYVVRSIQHIDQDFEDGCFRINDVVVSRDGNQLRLQKWPDLILAEDVNITGDLRPGSLVLVTVCVTEDQVLIVRSVEVIDQDDRDDDDFQGENQVTICHIPPGNPDNRHTITVGESAVDAHVSNHGDTLGPCP